MSFAPMPHAEIPVKLSVLLPVKNEGVTLPMILKILSAIIEVPHEILVIYDEPDDSSVPVVRALQARHPDVRLVHNTLGPGPTNAVRTGLRESKGPYVLIFAVDDTGPALAIDEMLTLMDRGCDLVSCTRYARGGRRLGGSIVGQVLSRVANRLFRWLTGSVLTDATTGIKMVRRSVFEQITLDASPVGWAVAFELAIKAQLAGCRLGEVPIISIDRLFGGKSTFALGPWIAQYLRWFAWGMRRLRASRGASRHVMTLKDAVESPPLPSLSPVEHVSN